MNVSEQRRLISAELADVHTCLPGVIVAYDGQFAEVRPTLAKQLANGDTLAAPKIVRVPVCWPSGDVNGAQALITVPLKAGDPVLLYFCERALDDWLGGLDSAPGDPRQFDLSDAFAAPMVRPGVGAKPDLANVSIQYGSGSIKLSPTGMLTIVAPQGVLMDTPLLTVTGAVTMANAGAITVTGSIAVTGDVTAGTVSLKTHRHGGVAPGSSTTSTPV